ncbi:MAG: hypothetical protein ABIT96_09450 [Ferruginibacter sp.]
MIIPLKEIVYNHYFGACKENVERLQEVLAELRSAAASETKSTAGDKHETALAMLQIEQVNVQGQLDLAKENLNKLLNLTQKKHEKVITGALVETDKGFFFISAALGKMILNAQMIIAISSASPLGIALQGKTIGETVRFREHLYNILSIH